MGIGELFEFEKTGRFDPEPRPTAYKSIAVWPDTISVGNVEGKNESSDTHSTWGQADAVCRGLRREGITINGVHVRPISTRVEPVWQ